MNIESRLPNHSRSAQGAPRAKGPRGWVLALFLVPAFVWLLFVFLVPIVQVIVTSFQRRSLTGSRWVGVENFQFLFTVDSIFWIAVRNNFVLLLGIPILIVMCILLAVLLFEHTHLQRSSNLYRTLVFIPYLVPTVVAAQVFAVVLRADGPLNAILNSVGLGFLMQAWLSDPNLVVFSILGVIIWRSLGLGVILFLARLATMDVGLLELAVVEGASWWQTVRRVIIPELRSTIYFYSILMVITMFAWVFNFVFVMTRGGPAFASMVLELHIFNYVMGRQQPNLAAATAVVLLAIVSIFIYLQYSLRAQPVRETS